MRHLRIYRAILAVVEEGSIRKAAERLTISPSALNRSIQAFEADLGVEVFERLAAGVRLSVQGEMLFRPISEHLAHFDDTLGLIAALKGDAAGTLRLSVARDLWPGPGAAAVERFRTEAPQVALETLSDDGAGALRSRQADLALVSLAATDDDLDVRLGGTVAVQGWAAPGAGGAAVRLSDLMERRVLVAPVGTGLRQSLDLMLRRTGVRPAAVLSLPGPPVALHAGPQPDLMLSLGPAAPPGLEHAQRLDLRALGLAPVQVALVARAGGYRPRVAERFERCLGAVLDAMAADADADAAPR